MSPIAIVLYILFGLVAAWLIWLIIQKDFFRKTRIFFGEMITELERASWPTRQELWDSTVVVIVASLLLGLFTSIADFSLYQFVDLFAKLAG